MLPYMDIYTCMACKKNMRNDVSHIKLEQPVSYINKKCVAAILDFRFFVHSLQNMCNVVHLGCVCGYIKR